MQKKSSLFASLLFSTCVIAGCASLPDQKPVSGAEQMRVDSGVGVMLVDRFEKGLVLKKDAVLIAYLKELAESLSSGIAELRDSSVAVRVFEPESGSIKNYSLPGMRIYVSYPFLKAVEYENELAAGIAIEIGHVLNHDLVNHVMNAKTSGQEPSLTPRSFEFTEDEIGAAIERAVEILYQKRYDPRGVLFLLDLYQSHPEIAPYPAEVAMKLRDRAYRAIVQYPPLRNPIVKSEEFPSLQKRIRKQ